MPSHPGTSIWKSKNIRTAGGILLLSGAVVGGHLLPGLDNSKIEDGVRNALHILVFAAFAVILFESMRRLGTPAAITATILATSIVGGLSEFLQYSAGRQPDVIDLVRDISGAALALFGWILWRRSYADGISASACITTRAVSVLVAMLVLTPLLYWLTVVGLNRSTFPTIISFDDWWERHLYYPVNAEIDVATSSIEANSKAGAAIEITLSGWGRSGLAILPMVSDWTEYKYLTFMASIVKGPGMTVTVRINDNSRKHHYADQFIARTIITEQPVLIRIPIEEMITEPALPAIDLSDIQEIVIFARDKRNGSVMMLGEIYLE